MPDAPPDGARALADTAQLERLQRLAALPDEDIDISDLPVIEDWSPGVRGGTPSDVRHKMAAASARAPPAPTPSPHPTAAVMAALASAAAPLDPASLASRFRQGRRVAPKVGSVLGALQRMGFVSSRDAGRTWSPRRVA